MSLSPRPKYQIYVYEIIDINTYTVSPGVKRGTVRSYPLAMSKALNLLEMTIQNTPKNITEIRFESGHCVRFIGFPVPGSKCFARCLSIGQYPQPIPPRQRPPYGPSSKAVRPVTRLMSAGSKSKEDSASLEVQIEQLLRQRCLRPVRLARQNIPLRS